jgi:uncharacterized membrane protein
MNMPPNLLPADLFFLAYLVWFLVLVQSVLRAPWRAFFSSRLLNVFLGSTVALMLLWSFNVSVTPGLGYHFLGVTVFTLMFGWSLGIIGASLASLGAALQAGTLASLSLNALVFGVLPVSLSYGFSYLVHRHLPHHVFVYIFLSAFLGAILTAAFTVFAAVGLLVLTEAYPYARIAAEYLPFLPLYLFPEGFLNGLLATVFIGLRPQWLKNFDDESYLNR